MEVQDEKKEKELKKLADAIYYAGFQITKETFDGMVNSKEQNPKILDEKTYGKDETRVTLNFNRSEQGILFFNSFDMELKKEGLKNWVQNFKHSYGNKITRKQAYNMMDGRSVNQDILAKPKEDLKTGALVYEKDENDRFKSYNVWTRLDFTEKDANGNYLVKRDFNFDLEKTLAQYPIKELEILQAKSDLINSLKVGNRQSVTFTNAEGKEEKKYIEANSKFSTLKVYDTNMNEDRFAYVVSKAESKAENQTVNNGKKLENMPGVKSAKNKKDVKQNSNKQSLKPPGNKAVKDTPKTVRKRGIR